MSGFRGEELKHNSSGLHLLEGIGSTIRPKNCKLLNLSKMSGNPSH